MKQERTWVRKIFYILLAALVVVGCLYALRPMDLMDADPAAVGKIVLTDCMTGASAEVTDRDKIDGFMAVLNAAGITRSGNAESVPPATGVLVAVYDTEGNLVNSWNNFYVVAPQTIERSGYVFSVRGASFNLDALRAEANQ